MSSTQEFTTLTEDTKLSTPEEMQQMLPQFKDIDELKEFISGLDTFSLEYLVKSLKLPVNPTYHSGIYRMRLSLALQKYIFPSLSAKDKKLQAKYRKLSDETLYKIAEDLELEYQRTNNPVIDRMYIIASLGKL